MLILALESSAKAASAALCRDGELIATWMRQLKAMTPESVKAYAEVYRAMVENGVRMTGEEIAAALPRWENNNSVRNTCCAVSTAEIKAILETHFSQTERRTT